MKNAKSEFLAGEPDREVLEEMVRRIVGAVHPVRIILFGSAARGQMGSDSDLDVLVVMPDGTLAHDRSAHDTRRGLSSAGLNRVTGEPKHRYVTFLGTNRQRRDLARSLRWPVSPYPKRIVGTDPDALR